MYLVTEFVNPKNADSPMPILRPQLEKELAWNGRRRNLRDHLAIFAYKKACRWRGRKAGRSTVTWLSDSVPVDLQAPAPGCPEEAETIKDWEALSSPLFSPPHFHPWAFLSTRPQTTLSHLGMRICHRICSTRSKLDELYHMGPGSFSRSQVTF
ncbi:uncharacterized protein VTP21DRAFT_4651 [Calcarisporiella thermophila]|uniref:uncharacterized protein n=1 Tax=Calcarisporiella thermophila TaxID=911321 RepID=UPI0037437A9C